MHRTFSRALFTFILAAALPAAAQTSRQSDADDDLAWKARLEALRQSLPRVSPLEAERHGDRWHLPGLTDDGEAGGRYRSTTFGCATVLGNPLSPLLAREDNERAARFEGFTLRDERGRRTKPWRSRSRAERARRGVEVQRPLLVFIETPQTQEDPDAPWFGPVRFDRPELPTTKEAIVEQVFGASFDFKDPESMAGFFHRESGGKLLIKGDASSVHTVTLPYMPAFDAPSMVEAILEQLDPVVDFSRRADEFGWAHPILIMTPYSYFLDVYEPELMGTNLFLGFGPTVFDVKPSFTNDTLADGTNVALATLAISHVAVRLGANLVPENPFYGLDDDRLMTDDVRLYAHEYSHSIGLSHMFTLDYGLDRERDGAFPFYGLAPAAGSVVNRIFPPSAFNRDLASGFVTTIMNYALSWDRLAESRTDARPLAGLDALNRAKLGWGNVLEIRLGDGPHELGPGEKKRVELGEHLGAGKNDPRPQILEVELPAQEVELFPRLGADGSPSGYWSPVSNSEHMVWSGNSYGGSRMMEIPLSIPANVEDPVLSFWTKYGAHTGPPDFAGYSFGWVQLSVDQGESWTSLPGLTSSTVVAPARAGYEWFGQALGTPAFTGDSRLYSPTGWIFESVPLPLDPGDSALLRFNFSGFGQFTLEPQDGGWWIDDIYLGTTDEPRLSLVSDFERDGAKWKGLLTEFDRGWGFVVVEETTPFRHSYFFELRGDNAHDELAFQEEGPKDLGNGFDFARNRYEKGVLGYYTNEYFAFHAFSSAQAGTANGEPVPLERLQRADISYPFAPQAHEGQVYDFGLALFLAQTPGTGVDLDDLVFFFGSPAERFDLFAAEPGLVYVAIYESAFPDQISLLDASPTYEPRDALPGAPRVPFFDRPVEDQPYVLGSAGGWPKSLSHGVLGSNDPDTVEGLGQPFLQRDAAFHPDRNPIFDDGIDYRGQFALELTAHHETSTIAALASQAPLERYALVPTTLVPVSDTESIQNYRARYCPHDDTGVCVELEAASTRPWIEQILYERFTGMLVILLLPNCPVPPAEQTLQTKPAWDAYYACFETLVATANGQGQFLVELTRELGQNPAYSFLDAYGPDGGLNPAYWADVYLGRWIHAKGPVPLPSYGFSMEVERIKGKWTPSATLELRRERAKPGKSAKPGSRRSRERRD